MKDRLYKLMLHASGEEIGGERLLDVFGCCIASLFRFLRSDEEYRSSTFDIMIIGFKLNRSLE
jgi:hypothetical protein